MSINKSDVDLAMDLSLSKGDIYLCCVERSDVPYVKRHLYHTLGEPNRAIGNTLHYDDKTIHLSYLSDQLGRRDDCFFIRKEYGLSTDHIDADEFIRFHTWKAFDMDAFSMKKALEYEGYSPLQALYLMAEAYTQGII